MSWKDKYDKRLSNDSIFDNFIDNFNEYLGSALNTFNVNINNSTSTIKMVIQTYSDVSSKKDTLLGLTSINDIVVVGDIVTWNNENLIIVEKIDKPIKNFNKVYIQKTNNILKYYDKNHISSQDIPCIISRTLNLNSEENKYLTTIDNEFYLTVSNNSTTQQIKVNDIYKIGISNYQISSVPDDISQQGLLIFKVKFSEAIQESHVYTIEILNGTTVDIQEGSTLQLNCNVYDNNVLLSPTPSLTYVSSNTAICTVNSSGFVTATSNIGSCTITVSLTSDNSVLDTINTNVIAVPQNNFTYTLISNSQPDTEIIINQTKNYVVQKYNNGTLIPQAFTFSVVGDNTAYQLTVVDSNNCSIKALKSGKTITLQVVDDGDNSKIIEKTITLKSLF